MFSAKRSRDTVDSICSSLAKQVGQLDVWNAGGFVIMVVEIQHCIEDGVLTR